MVLTDGINHVAVLTEDLDRLVAWYGEVFGAEVIGFGQDEPDFRMVALRVGPSSELNVFQIRGNEEAARQTPMFGRGRLDHLALNAPDLEAFTEIRARLMARGASDGFVTDFGPLLSLFFRDPDGLEAEVCTANPDAVAGEMHPPGTPSRRFHPEG